MSAKKSTKSQVIEVVEGDLKPLVDKRKCATCKTLIYEGENWWTQLVDPIRSVWQTFHHDCTPIPEEIIKHRDWKEGASRLDPNAVPDEPVEIAPVEIEDSEGIAEATDEVTETEVPQNGELRDGAIEVENIEA